MNYKEVIRATDPRWKSDLRGFLTKGVEVVVIDVAPEQFSDCKAFAQEFDYTTYHEDRAVLAEYPDKLPSKIGFGKRRR
jgi:hypothetical protein